VQMQSRLCREKNLGNRKPKKVLGCGHVLAGVATCGSTYVKVSFLLDDLAERAHVLIRH
jgi:hypothetical protein